MEPILLASASPRRQELMRQLGFPITIMAVDTDESLPAGIPVDAAVVAIARRKVEKALTAVSDRHMPWMLGADTLIEADGRVMGKPACREEARSMLANLAGRSHCAHTGLSLRRGKDGEFFEDSFSTRVTFRQLSEREIAWYLDSGEWQGVAGGYRIQGRAGLFVDGVEGQFHTVVGLPLSGLYGILTRAGYEF